MSQTDLLRPGERNDIVQFRTDIIEHITRLNENINELKQQFETLLGRVEVLEETQRSVSRNIISVDDNINQMYYREIINTRIVSEARIQNYYELKLRKIPECSSPGNCRFASATAFGAYKQYYPTTNPRIVQGIVTSPNPEDALLLTDGSEPDKITKTFREPVLFRRHEKTCMWRKENDYEGNLTLDGYQHDVILVSIDGRTIIIDWSVGQFQNTNNFVFVAELADVY